MIEIMLLLVAHFSPNNELGFLLQKKFSFSFKRSCLRLFETFIVKLHLWKIVRGRGEEGFLTDQISGVYTIKGSISSIYNKQLLCQ